MKIETWSHSVREELLATLKLIAGLLAWQNEMYWLAWVVFVLCGMDVFLAIRFALIEIAVMKTNTPRATP